jgi:hypothetical protein
MNPRIVAPRNKIKWLVTKMSSVIQLLLKAGQSLMFNLGHLSQVTLRQVVLMVMVIEHRSFQLFTCCYTIKLMLNGDILTFAF